MSPDAQDSVPCLHPEPFGVRIELLVVPGASRDEIVGLHGECLRVRVSAPPEHGRANAALLELLAARLGRRRTDLSLVSGRAARRKTVRVRGIDLPAVRSLLGV